MSREPVVTGTGIISAAGNGVDAVWRSISSDKTGLGPLTLFSSGRFGEYPVGQAPVNLASLVGNVRGSRSDKLAWIAAREALKVAGLDAGLGGVNPRRVGVMLGATVGGMFETGQVLTRWLRDKKRRFGPLRFHECAGATDLCARKMGALGPCGTISTACSAGAMALYAAAEMIARGEADIMVAGAGDALCQLTLNGFGSLLLLDPKPCRPFDSRRAGINLGEGAAVFIIEAEETANARGATILARLAGWGASCDAFHATAPHPEGAGAVAAMRRALENAGAKPEEIDFVCAHGTGTPDNDAMEGAALQKVFGETPPPFASVKSFFGHTLAASGPIQGVLAVESLRRGGVPGVPGFELADTRIGLQPVRQFRVQDSRQILSNSFGFGGNNVALVFRSASLPARHPRATHRRSAFSILGAGLVSPCGTTMREVAAAFTSEGAALTEFDATAIVPNAKTPVYACPDLPQQSPAERAKTRRLSRLQRMGLFATRQSLGAIDRLDTPEQACVAIGTGLGSLSETATFVENLILNEERAPRPAHFANSVHNSAAAQVAMEFQFTGLNSTPVQRDISFETALWQGACELGAQRAALAVVGAADELNAYQIAAGVRWKWWNKDSPPIRPFAAALAKPRRPLPGEGCAIFALGPETATGALAKVAAIRIGRSALNDAPGEAAWVAETLRRDDIAPGDVDVFLTGASGDAGLDCFYAAVADEFSKLAGHEVPCLGYKHCSGDHYSASAFGFFVAIGMVRGEIRLAHRSRTIVLLTLGRSGAKGMCCIQA